MNAATTDATKEHRRMKRRLTKKGTLISCRKGSLGLGPNLAIRVHDVSEDGLRLLVKSHLAQGDEVEISLTPPGLSKPLVLMAAVAWCTPKEGEGFWIGVRFRTRLSYSDIFHLT